jgi:Fe-S-cluster-containing hydrogenase component 2
MSYAYVDSSRCTGCGTCVAICPARAIGVVDGVASVDQARCDLCQKCLAICPDGAIVLVLEPAQEWLSRSYINTDTPVVGDNPNPVAVSLRSQLVPLAGSTLLLLAKQLIPRILPHVLAALNHSMEKQQVAISGERATPTESSSGHRFRGRHRGA